MSIIVKNLTFSYDEKCLVENLNFDISNGSIGLIKGESGSGKSTLLNVIAGLKKADSGNVVCNNKVYMDENTAEETWFDYIKKELKWAVKRQDVDDDPNIFNNLGFIYEVLKK